MRGLLDRRGTAIALVAALIFVVQASLSVWAGAAAAAQPMLDAFGNPLCITSDDGSSLPGDDHARQPNCCTLGCSTFSPVLPEPDRGALDVATFRGSDVLLPPGTVSTGLRGLDHAPGSPRAPPQIV